MRDVTTAWIRCLTWALGATFLAVLGGCGGSGNGAGTAGGSDDNGSGGGDADSPPFEVRLDGASSATAPRASSGELRLVLERRQGFTDAVTLALEDPPAGVSSTVAVSEGPTTRAVLSIRIAEDTAQGPAPLVVLATGGGATSRVAFTLVIAEARPSSQALIAQALAAGRIDYPTSLLYRLYALFGAAELPDEFAGSGSTEDLEVFVAIERDRAQLQGEVLDRMTPYLARPDDPRSIHSAGVSTNRASTRERPAAGGVPAPDTCAAAQVAWTSEHSSTHPVRVWALCDGTDEGNLRTRLQVLRVLGVVDTVYQKMVDLMGPPISDEWADASIDLYVVSGSVMRHGHSYAAGSNRGVAPPQPPYKGATSSGTVLIPEWRVAERDFELTVIHEFFHVLQFAHNYTLTTHWFTEASASWASFHFNRVAPVRPDDNRGLYQERYTDGFQNATQGLLGTEGQNAYYSFAWPLFMEQQGGAAMIGGAWKLFEQATGEAGRDNALDFLLPFRENFRTFALRNVNHPMGPDYPLPEDKRFVGLDPKFPDLEGPKAPKFKSHSISPGQRQPVSLGRPIEPLSAAYFTGIVADGSVKKVTVGLQGVQGNGVDIDALVNIDGAWESAPRNLNGKDELVFCLDDPKEKLVAITLIVSNHAKQVGDRATAEIGFEGSTTPCATVWKGSSTITIEGPGYVQTASAEVVFEFDDKAPPSASQPFRLRSGNYGYSWKSGGQCPITQSASGAMLKQGLDPAIDGSTNARFEVYPGQPASYAAGGGTIIDYKETDCHGNVTDGGRGIDWLLVEGPGLYFLSEDGNTAEGSATTVNADGTIRARWSFTRSRE